MGPGSGLNEVRPVIIRMYGRYKGLSGNPRVTHYNGLDEGNGSPSIKELLVNGHVVASSSEVRHVSQGQGSKRILRVDFQSSGFLMVISRFGKGISIPSC